MRDERFRGGEPARNGLAHGIVRHRLVVALFVEEARIGKRRDAGGTGVGRRRPGARGAWGCRLPGPWAPVSPDKGADFWAAPSTSALTIRPRGPEPCSAARSTPELCAMRLASGEAKMRCSVCGEQHRCPLFHPPLEGEGRCRRGFGGSGCGWEISRGGFCRLPPARAASRMACMVEGISFGGAASSPSVSSTAMGALTFTPSAPSGTRIFPIRPSSMASNSIVALSVSISAKMSPAFTASPSLTCHLASLPSSMVGDSAGIRMFVDMA